MAHQQKYYKEIDSNGIRWRVEIWQDTDEIITPTEIGPVVQGLRLVIQGDQADVDTPIVKTSLEMQFIDAPGLEYERKCGYWEEFYTSSATEYQVRLYKDGVIEWTGYITPDSFSEDLRYRGSVSIIARDNLGTLQDTTCDLTPIQNADGKVRISILVSRAVRVISTCAMELEMNEEDFPSDIMVLGKYDLSNSLLWQMVDTKLLHENNWWEALEKVLYSIGACIRYVGGNKLKLVPIRDLPKCGQVYWQDVEIHDVNFLAYGHRELVPAIKSIREVHEFDVEGELEAERINGYSGTATQSITGITLFTADGITIGPDYNVPSWGYTNPRTNINTTAANSSLLNVNGYPKVKGEDSESWGAWDDESIVYFLVNSREPAALQHQRKIYTKNGKVEISFVVDKPVTLTEDYAKVLNLPIVGTVAASSFPTLQYSLRHVNNSGNTQYYNAISKSWQSASLNNIADLNIALFTTDKPDGQIVKIEDVTLPDVGTLILDIKQITIETLQAEVRQACRGLYMRIRDLKFNVTIPEDITLLSKLSLTTEYSDKYSVRLNRQPEFAINATELQEVAYVPNAILTEGEHQYYGADKFVWHDGEEGISLARLIHQQLLAYYSEPNNLLTGELVSVERESLPLNAIYYWRDRPHMLMAGKLNLLTGRIEGASLRGFTRYDHMWETWAENEDIVVDYAQSSIAITIHSNKTLTSDSWKNLPEWIAPLSTQQTSPGVWVSNLIIKKNDGAERTAYIMIDTAIVKINQFGTGDYNIDYGRDYS